MSGLPAMDPAINVAEYYRAVEMSKMRQLMRYDRAAFESDWALAVACAQIMAVTGRNHLQPVLDSAMMRVLAWMANDRDALPFIETQIS